MLSRNNLLDVIIVWCNSRGVNSTHHGHYTMVSADSKFDDLSVFLFCSVFNLNNKNVKALIARQLSGFICTRSLTINSKFGIEISGP